MIRHFPPSILKLAKASVYLWANTIAIYMKYLPTNSQSGIET